MVEAQQTIWSMRGVVLVFLQTRARLDMQAHWSMSLQVD